LYADLTSNTLAPVQYKWRYHGITSQKSWLFFCVFHSPKSANQIQLKKKGCLLWWCHFL